MTDRADRATRNGEIDYGPLDQRLGYILRRAQVAIFQDFYRKVGALDISPAQYSTLCVIEHNPGLTQTQVAEALGIKKTNFVALIKELVARNLARRSATPSDRRSFALYLTEKGAETMRQVHAASAEHEENVRRAVGEQEYERLFAPLRRIAEAVRE